MCDICANISELLKSRENEYNMLFGVYILSSWYSAVVGN